MSSNSADFSTTETPDAKSTTFGKVKQADGSWKFVGTVNGTSTQVDPASVIGKLGGLPKGVSGNNFSGLKNILK
jgi:hypothetical protein